MANPWESKGNDSAKIWMDRPRLPWITSPPDQRRRGNALGKCSEERRSLIQFARDVGPESAQRLGKARIAAVDVICPADRRRAVGNQAGDDKRSAGADVTCLYGGPGDPPDPVQHDVVAIDPRLGPQTRELLHGTEPRLEDVLGNHRAALGNRVVAQCKGLKIGGEPRVGQRGYVER